MKPNGLHKTSLSLPVGHALISFASALLIVVTVYSCRNPHEARETYKTLKDQNIGGAAESADLYCQWASLEIKAGLSQLQHTL